MSNLNFEKMVDYFPEGVFRLKTTATSKFLYVNTALCKMLGVSKSEVMRLNVEKIFLESRRYKLFHRKIILEKALKTFEVKIGVKGKKSCWVSLSAVLVETGKDKFIDVSVHDITKRKHQEEALHASRSMFQTVFDHTAAAITVTDENERIIAWNPYAEKMLGMTGEDFFNKPIRELYLPKEWKRLRAMKIRKKGVRADIETQIQKKDGTVLDASVSITILKKPDGGKTGSIGIIRDMTAQKQAERRIIESENKTRIILDNSPAAIMLTDDKERIVSWNMFSEKLLGMKKKDFYLKPVSMLYPPEEWKKIRAANIRKIGSKHHMESKVIRKDGTLVDVDLSVNILKDVNGNISGAVGIIQDITEQKKIKEMLLKAKQAAEDANKSKSMFLSSMSHEIRTPMNAIIGMLDLTLDTELTEEQKDNLVVAKDASGNLLSLINDILDLSRVEAGKISLEAIEINLHNVVRNICKGLLVLANAKYLDLVVNIDKDVPEFVMGDPVRIRQVVINLVNNAIKFTHQGKVTCEVKLKSKTKTTCEVVFNVIDEGIGIPKEAQAKVFEAFSQADSSTTRQFGGTGLGLAICVKLVALMKGKIWLESEVNVGSTFSFTAKFKILSTKEALNVGGSQKGLTDMVLDKVLVKLKILLAEDNLVNQKIAMRILEKKGCIVTPVVNGQEVLHELEKGSFDVILMDAQMPVLDGIEATRLIRKNEESTGQHMPIIALTARAMQDDRKEFDEVGMDGYVAKPIDRTKLYEEIGKIIKKG